ncbi:MAG: SgcJ/EcaC family oxidoreductase [Candidatus Eremiobacteraeota bacterium]|nr:SgcJ/EcaC family oxidoreductase [Candidatus Eremiobacteraeota bacterium]
MTDSTNVRAGADAIAAALTAAWNAADGAAFAREFTGDADFVNIFAMHFVGREAVAKAHEMIFDTIYRGSHNSFTVEKVRPLGDDAAVALIRANLQVPSGPMAGNLVALATAVIVRDGDAWRIVTFHNTREQAPPPIKGLT